MRAGKWRTELGQYTESGFGMEKGNLLSTGPFNRHFMDQTDSGPGSLTQLARNILHCESHMMDAFTAFFQKPGDRAILRSGLKQFDVGITD